MRGVMQHQFTFKCDSLIEIMTGDSEWSRMQLFITKYILQSILHVIWRERNRRRHDESPRPAALLVKQIDKNMRNMITIQQRKGDKDFAGAMAIWFGTRQS
ncbi:hypothetical protein N665_0791s0018 [Sinapis alba]|nr:hypothetical protein N665_0791s0018 [Sinapis alba]